MPDTNNQIVNACMPSPALPQCSGRLLRPALPVLLAAAFLLLLVLPAAAHAPSNITIAYNPDMHKLSVSVTHPVDDPKTHYIKRVQVKINGEVISDPDYKSQPWKNSFTYTYDVMANPEDSVWVVATCVNGQSLENHIDIQKPVTTATTVETTLEETTTMPPVTTAPATTRTTHAAAGLLPLIGAAGVMAVLRK